MPNPPTAATCAKKRCETMRRVGVRRNILFYAFENIAKNLIRSYPRVYLYFKTNSIDIDFIVKTTVLKYKKSRFLFNNNLSKAGIGNVMR